MKAKMLLLLGVCFLLGADAPKDDTAAKEVEKALQALNEAFVKNDMATVKRLMADEHIAITSYFGKQSRDEQIKDEVNLKLSEYKVSDLKVVLLTKETAVVTYALTMKGTYKGKEVPPRSIATSVWVQRAGKWLEASYQETAVDGK